MEPACSRLLQGMAAVRIPLADCIKRPTSQKALRRIVQVANVWDDYGAQLATAVDDLQAVDARSLASFHPAICVSLSKVLLDSLNLLSRVLPANFFAAGAAAKSSELSSWSSSELTGVARVVNVFSDTLQTLHHLNRAGDVAKARELEVVVALLPLRPCRLLASAATLLEADSTTCIPPSTAFMYLFICGAQSPESAARLHDELRSAPMLQLTCNVAMRVMRGDLDNVQAAAHDGLIEVHNKLVALSFSIVQGNAAAAAHASECVMWRWLLGTPAFGQMLLHSLALGRDLHRRLCSVSDESPMLFVRLMAVTARWLKSNQAVSYEINRSGAPSAALQTAGHGGSGSATAAATAAPASGGIVRSPLVTALHVTGTLQAVAAFGFLTVGRRSTFAVEQGLRKNQPLLLIDTCSAISEMWLRLDRRAQSCAFIPAVSFAHQILRGVLPSHEPRGTVSAIHRGGGGPSLPFHSPATAAHVVATASDMPPDGSTHKPTVEPSLATTLSTITEVGGGGRPSGHATVREGSSAARHDDISATRTVWAVQPPHVPDGDHMSLSIPYMALYLLVKCVEPSRVGGGFKNTHGLQSRAEWVARSGVLCTCEALLRGTASYAPCRHGDAQLPVEFGHLAFRLALDAVLLLPAHQQARAASAPPADAAPVHAAHAPAQAASADQAQAALLSITASLRKLIVRQTHHAAGVYIATLEPALRPLCFLSEHGFGRLTDHQGGSATASRDVLRLCMAQLLLPTVRQARACVCVRYKCDHDPCTHRCNKAAHGSVSQALRALMRLAGTLHEHGLEDVTLAAGVPTLLREMLRASAASDDGSPETFAHRLNNCLACWDLLVCTVRHAGWRDEAWRQDLLALVSAQVCDLSAAAGCSRDVRFNTVALQDAPHVLALLPPLLPRQAGHTLEMLASCMRAAYVSGCHDMSILPPVEPSHCRTLLRSKPNWDSCIAAAALPSSRPLQGGAAAGGMRQPAATAAFVGCWYRGCGNVDGASEAALPLQRCSGCRLARYCCKLCQRRAWIGGHREVCTAWQQRSSD